MTVINYPAGQITPSGARRLLERAEPIMGYRSPGEVINWDLMGPKSPTPGVQEGVTVKSIKGLMPPSQTRDQQGANQHGVTFTSAVYDPVMVDMECQITGLTPHSTQQVVRRWIESWAVEHQGELYCITEGGYWYAPVRWVKTPTNPLANVYNCRQDFLWTARADDGFWRSLDSLCVFGDQPGQLGNAVQKVELVNGPTGGTFPLSFKGVPTAGIARYATPAQVQTALRAISTIGANNVTVTGADGGPWFVEFTGALAGSTQPLMGTPTTSLTGGIFPFTRVTTTTAGGAGAGFNTLTNIGDQPGWINHVVYGPFDEVQISNGQGGPMVKFGPLYANQIALLRTEPRRRGVYDLTPAAANVPTQQLNDWQKFLKSLISFATNNNIPPLLRQFESWFGIMPPQGEFYALLDGRFTKAVPPKPEGLPPIEGHISVSIKGGTAASRIESYLTPRRRYPL